MVIRVRSLYIFKAIFNLCIDYCVMIYSSLNFLRNYHVKINKLKSSALSYTWKRDKIRISHQCSMCRKTAIHKCSGRLTLARSWGSWGVNTPGSGGRRPTSPHTPTAHEATPPTAAHTLPYQPLG